MKRILMVAVESKPYATAGGTSAVVGALSGALRQRGYDVRLVLPYYSTMIRDPDYQVDYEQALDVPVGGTPPPPLPENWPESLRTYLRERRDPVPKAYVYRVHSTRSASTEEVPLYMIGGDPYRYFARVNGMDVPIYPSLEDVSVNAGRLYTFFCRAVLEMVAGSAEQGWKPDIIHCHDWPAALIPVLLKHASAEMEALQGVKVVLTIHNASDVVYQGGWFGPELLHYAHLPQGLFDYGQVQHQGFVNFMKAGIVFSDAVNTVSEGYAEEIMGSAEENYVDIAGTRKSYRYSGGLDYVWSLFHIDLVGIRNGIDEFYDPALIGQGQDWDQVDRDWVLHYTPAQDRPVGDWAYSAHDPQLWRKKLDLKRYLQERCNRLLRTDFGLDETIPLIAVRSRLVEQKGFDLLLQGLWQWDFERPVQFVIVAWGEDAFAVQYRRELEELADKHPGHVAFSRSWRDIPEALHYAGADMLLMPSFFEPCGLPHMMALRYGTIPIVRRTGGLADVVENYNPIATTGNGFDFVAPDYREMLEAVERALQVYASPAHWQALVQHGVQARDRHGRDFSWDTSVDHYIEGLYV